MRHCLIFPGICFLLMICLLFSGCNGGEGGPMTMPSAARTTLDVFLEIDNAGKEAENYATESTGQVRIEEGSDLSIVAYAPDGNSYLLRREDPAEIDMLLPKVFENATLVYADRSAIIINHEGKYHYVLSLDQEPALPGIPDAEFVVFSGSGLIRFWNE